MRQIKSRLVTLTGRVQKVRDELEHLLNDDDDMAEMYLTDKLMQQNRSKWSYSYSSNEQDDDLEEEGLDSEVPLEETDTREDIQDKGHNTDYRFSGDSPGTHTCRSRSGSKHLNVEELEMLLEAYFVQIDSTLNKLSTLREYVDDTEDYMNIMLDDKQNRLLQLGVVLTTATLVVSAFLSLTGVFGINIHIDLFDQVGMYEFSWTVAAGTTGCVFLYIMAITWYKQRGLLG